MATNYKHSGKRILVTSSAAIAAGDLVAQDGFVGIALTKATASAQSIWLGIEGVWNIAVPQSTVQGDLLYATHTQGVIADSATALSLSRTGANSNQPVVKAVTARDAAGYADVLILPQAAQKSATQV
jgi:predicted RecA/RadA family phage recombinase